MLKSHVQELNSCWSVERVIALLDATQLHDAKALAEEWDYPWFEDEVPMS